MFLQAWLPPKLCHIKLRAKFLIVILLIGLILLIQHQLSQLHDANQNIIEPLFNNIPKRNAVDLVCSQINLVFG